MKPDYVVIGEASEMNLKVGQRGRAEIVVETFGVPAHSADPERGVNAVYKMCEAIQAIREIEPPVQNKTWKRNPGADRRKIFPISRSLRCSGILPCNL